MDIGAHVKTQKRKIKLCKKFWALIKTEFYGNSPLIKQTGKQLKDEIRSQDWIEKKCAEK